MRFSIRFLTPFRVAAGRAGEGADSTIDRANPLPASSLKGVMRSAARDLLCLDKGWVAAVYGGAWQPSPWSWSDAAPQRTDGTPLSTRVRARIEIAAETSTVVKGALAIAEEVLADKAEFTVTRAGWIPAHLVAAHEAVLTASARAVTAVGGDRRRGLGWVCVTPVDPAWPTDETEVAAHVSLLTHALATLPDPEEPR